ncbi:hypothetical protein [Verrucomicrobium sp. 3C]|uniref:hypothetical protein n=1 Tax=Verrucomicrobium sp. 3C TaxID=1134055 RepID=UPI0012DD7B16|nr:hypothetical protein [Verrucomicrobium sp. 3C]
MSIYYLDVGNPLSITYLNPAAMVDPSQTSCASSPDIRGRQSLTSLNGIEESVNFGLQDVPWNFNMVESMDLVEGPPGAVYGATQPSNGYVNYITKQPYFDRFRGNAWATMGMYDQYMWGADIGGPIDRPAEGQSSKLGYRFSYLGINNGSYYDYIFDQQENFYGAIGWRPNDRYHADLYADFGTYSYMLEDVLMNRPTESLIRDDLYYPGYPPLSQVSSPGTVPASNFLSTPVPVSRRQTIKYPGDLGRAITGMAQLIQSVVVSDDLQVVNNTLFWYQDHIASEDEIFFQEAWNAYEINNRTEVRGKFTTPGLLGPMEHFLDTGIEWRYQQVLAYDSLEFTVPNQWSFFENPYLRNGTFSPYFQAWVDNPSAPGGGEWLVPGGPYPFYFEPLNGATGTNLTRYWKVSPFWQQTIQLTDTLSVILGARLDLYMISAQPPPGHTRHPVRAARHDASPASVQRQPDVEALPVDDDLLQLQLGSSDRRGRGRRLLADVHQPIVSPPQRAGRIGSKIQPRPEPAFSFGGRLSRKYLSLQLPGAGKLRSDQRIGNDRDLPAEPKLLDPSKLSLHDSSRELEFVTLWPAPDPDLFDRAGRPARPAPG